MIEEIPIAKLDPRQIKQLESADEAAQTNPTYAMEIYGAILKQNQGCLQLRQKLRALQLKKLQGSTKGLSGILNKVTSAPFMFRGKTDKDPEGAILKAEALLEKSPANVLAHQMLADGSTALGMLNTVVFAYDTIRKIQPKDIKNLKQLGNAYLEAGNSEMAIKTGIAYDSSTHPTEMPRSCLKEHRRSGMNKGKWENRRLPGAAKDESEAQSWSKPRRPSTIPRAWRKSDSYQKVEEEPANLNYYRQLSDYYQRYGDCKMHCVDSGAANKKEGKERSRRKERQLTLEYYDQSINAGRKLARQP